MTFSPAGFLRTPEQGLARLHWHEGAWAVDGQALDLAQLRPLRGLDIDWPTAEGVPDSGRPSGGAHGAGRSGVEGAHDAEWPGVEDALGGLARLAAAGVPLTASYAPAWVPVDLAALLTDRSWLEHTADDGVRCLADLRREEHSVRLRRLAAASRSRTAKVSVVMATRRPGFVGGALAQMARQRGVEVEVMLGLHGVAYERGPAGRRGVPAAAALDRGRGRDAVRRGAQPGGGPGRRRLPRQVGRRRLVRPRPPGRPDHGGRSLGRRHRGHLGGVLLPGAAAYHDQAHDVRVRGGLSERGVGRSRRGRHDPGARGEISRDWRISGAASGGGPRIPQGRTRGRSAHLPHPRPRIHAAPRAERPSTPGSSRSPTSSKSPRTSGTAFARAC